MEPPGTPVAVVELVEEFVEPPAAFLEPLQVFVELLGAVVECPKAFVELPSRIKRGHGENGPANQALSLAVLELLNVERSVERTASRLD